jgi:glycosyltransferase involved in cell wall biosynthesis
MRFLLLNQCFHPDVMATAQQLTDLAVGLVQKGHDVTVVASNRGYDDSKRRFPNRETWNGVKIIRISSLAMGKQSRWRRAINFASFMLTCSGRLLLLPRFDAVVALTSPPLISFLGSAFTRLKGGKFFFWVMDLNPDEAVAAGWLKRDSASARFLQRLLHSSLAHAEKVIALDQFMKERIVDKGIPGARIEVLAPWAQDDRIRFDAQGREAFREQHQLAGSFVVMYAGNHSPCHPLDTLLEAARRLSDREGIVFMFVGGGSEQEKVKQFSLRYGLENIRCLPYEPIDNLPATLSAADLHTVVMGDDFVGIVHPSKIYNVITVGSPFLYVGPKESHVTQIAARLNGNGAAFIAGNGDVDAVVDHILMQSKLEPRINQNYVPEIADSFSKQTLLPRMIALLESAEAS